MTGRLDGRIALVTGASRGIGRACAERLAEEGADVIVVDMRRDEGEAVAQAIGGRFHPLDVTSEADWQALAADIDKAHGRLDVLVNNAGIAILVPDTSQMSLADWERQMAVNVTGVFLGCKYAIPLMRKAGGGSMINMSSAAGMRGSAGMAGYCASKGAVRLLSKSLAAELGKDGIRVNSVHPGLIATDIWQGLGATSVPDGNLDRLSDMAERMVPMVRRGEPLDIADGVVWLASDESRYVSGSELVIDGAMTAK